MIQRIQTVYLLIVAGLMLAMLFLPLGYVNQGLNIEMLDVFGLHAMDADATLVTPYTLYYLPICSGILALITIFFYKRRKLQINLCYLTIFSLVLFYVFLFMYIYVPGGKFPYNVEFVIATVFPIIAIIIEFLAIRGIRKDEKLVRSLDRLR